MSPSWYHIDILVICWLDFKYKLCHSVLKSIMVILSIYVQRIFGRTLEAYTVLDKKAYGIYLLLHLSVCRLIKYLIVDWFNVERSQGQFSLDFPEFSFFFHPLNQPTGRCWKAKFVYCDSYTGIQVYIVS